MSRTPSVMGRIVKWVDEADDRNHRGYRVLLVTAIGMAASVICFEVLMFIIGAIE